MVTYSYNTWNHSASWGLDPTLPEQIAAAAAAGYDFVGLDVPSLRAHAAAGLAPGEIGRLMAGHGVACYELVALQIAGGDGGLAEALDEVAGMARALGARQVLAVARGPLDAGLVAATRRCVELLAANGVGVSVEFLPSIELDSIDGVRRLVAEVGSPDLRVLVDSWHFFAGPSTWESLAALERAELGFVQFSDAAVPETDDVVHEYRHRRVLPGEGVHDLHRFAASVLAKHPDVTVSVEVLSEPWRRRRSGALAAVSLEATRRYWEP